MNPLFDPAEDYNESMSYTDPRGASKYKHFRNHPEFEVESEEDAKFWWIVPVICMCISLAVLSLCYNG